MRTMRRK